MTLLEHAERLAQTRADLRIVDALSHAPANWLAFASTDLDAVLDAFALYLERCEADARFSIVGAAEDALRSRVAELDLGAHVRFFDAADFAAIKALYLCADALIAIGSVDAPSIAGAMILGTPIVAAGLGDIATTAGDAALDWNERDAALVAASVERLREDPVLREALRANGFARIRALAAREAAP